MVMFVGVNLETEHNIHSDFGEIIFYTELHTKYSQH